MKALICVDGRDLAGLLAATEAALSNDAEWVLLHVVDTSPLEEAGRALGGLLGRGPRPMEAERQIWLSAALNQDEVRAEIETWLREKGRAAEVIIASGRPEHEILRAAEERGAHIIVLRAGHPGPGPHRGPGPRPLGPIARFVVDHALCDVLLLR